MLRGIGRRERSLPSKQVERGYLKLVQDIPEVVEVRLADDDEGAAIWTIISATPFDDVPRDRVIMAQMEVMKKAECDVGFHLINLEELDREFRTNYMSGIGTVLWAR